MAEVSALPNAMRQRMEAMQADPPPAEPIATTPVAGTPPTTPTADSATPPETPAGERVTLSREEYNELQAAAGKVQTAAGRAEAAAQKVAELEARLTELSEVVKSTPQAPKPSLTVDPASIQFTEQEQQDFGDSREFISKVAKLEVAQVVSGIEARLADLETQIKGVATTAQNIGQTSFSTQLKSRVPNLTEIIGHKNWADYLDAVEPMTGATFEQLLRGAIQGQRLDSAVNIYKAFEKQYMGATPPSVDGYAGITPSGGATVEPPTPTPTTKLKASARTKASEDYRKGRITWDQLQEVTKKFDEADRQGNVDYTQ